MFGFNPNHRDYRLTDFFFAIISISIKTLLYN